MVVFYALMSAFAYGTADFLGGFSTRKNSAALTVAWSQMIGLITVLIAAPFIGKSVVTPADLLWGMAGGMSGGLGLLFLYRGLSSGIAAIVSPTAALFGAAIPVIFGLLIGERPPLLTWIGVAFSLPAILFLSWEKGAKTGHIAHSVRHGIISGTFFAGFFIILVSRTSEQSGLWPLAAARAVTVPVFMVLAYLRGKKVNLAKGTRKVTFLSGFLDMAANVLYLLAGRTGYMIIAVILSSLYPAPTVVLQKVFLKEKLPPLRILGLILSIAAAALIGIGG